MKQKLDTKNLFFLAMCFLVATINYPKHNINNIALIFLGLIWLYSFKSKAKEKLKVVFKSRITTAFTLFFIVYCVGLLHTSNIKVGLNEVKLKLPLLLIPLIISSSQTVFTSLQQKILKYVFIFATISLLLYTIIAIYFDLGVQSDLYKMTGIKSYLHSELTVKIDNHPTYLSYTIIICSLFLMDLYQKKQIKTVVFSFIYLGFLIYILLLSSKTGVIIFIVLTIYFFQKRVKNKYKLPLIILILFSIVSLISLTDLGKRFKDEWKSIKTTNNLKDKTIHYSSKNQRIIAIDIFLNQPASHYLIGLGTGNVQDYLDKKYRYYLETKHRNAFKKLNYHNQYFQTNGATGLVGLALLLYLLYLSIQIAFKHKKQNHIFFVVITILFFWIESFFETQRGVMLFILTNSLFVFLFKE